MKHTHGEGVLVLALFAALAGCADPASRTVGPTGSTNIVTEPASASAGAERVALTKIARLVAVAMDNEPARQHLKHAMRSAPFKEHKLQLTNYLSSKDGRALLESMARATRGGEREVLTALYAIRPLEFYMPVQKHRESWTGKDDILVVSQLNESEPIVAFDESGKEVSLDRKVAPDQPTLSIVPVETQFDQPLGSATSRNVGDLGGNAIGTLQRLAPKGSSLVTCIEACEGGGGSGGGGVPPTIPPGVYLEFSRILDAKEPWFRGEPEIEVHVQGPQSVSTPRYGVDLSCSGEHAYDFRKVFNQDAAFWEGRVMLFSAEETAAFVSKFNEGFHVLFWEDDNEPCTLRLDSNALVALLNSGANAFGTVAIKLLPKASNPIIAAVFVATLFSNAGQWLLTNDDYLGVAVAQANAGYAYPGNTHVIMDGTTLNGRATIVYRQ
jgi:hypothetical protein